MGPHGRRIKARQSQRGAIGLWFRLAYYLALMVICMILVGVLYVGSLVE